MHSEPQGGAAQPCAWCTAIFAPKRGWAKFCGTKCRNDYHRWAKPNVVRELRDIVRQAAEGADPKAWQPRARKLLGIKPVPTHPVAREVAATLAEINAAADRRDAATP